MAWAPRVPCANVFVNESGQSHNCSESANSICSKCHLVKYCRKECQVAHWSQHKLDCNCALRKETWQPAWHKESRQPAFVNSVVPRVSFGHLRYLWGNVPAFDVLRLADNEGLEYDQDLNLCFAASGDLRNVLMSLNTVPETYHKTCVCIINDKYQLVQVRNVIMLLLALHQPPIDGAEGMILHLWYSARLKPEMLRQMRRYIRPSVAHVVEQIEKKKNDRLFSKTWTFGTQAVCARFNKAQWIFFLSVLDVEHTIAESEKERHYIMLNEDRIDYRHRHLFSLSPSKRVAFEQMRETGVLLPFGTCNHEFTVTNPLLFDVEKGNWLSKDSANPLDSWSSDLVAGSGARFGAPSADIYGHLYLHVIDVIKVFRASCAMNSNRYELYCLDCRQLGFILPSPLGASAFDRIETSNIADRCYLGLSEVLSSLGPLLKTPKQNMHATLITLFMNAVAETWDTWDFFDKMRSRETQMRKVAEFLPSNSSLVSMSDPVVLRSSAARDLFRDYDRIFATFMQRANMTIVAARAGMEMRKQNSVIAKWPWRFTKRSDEPGAKDAFRRAMESGSDGNERYVEWVRK